MRLIAIVLGEEVSKVRNSETMALLDYGFNTYQVQIIKKKNEIVKTENIEKASTKKIEYVPVTDIGILSKKGDTKKKYSYDIKITKNKLPLTKGEIVGKIKIKDGNTVVGEKDITVKESTKKLSYLTLLRNTIYDIASGNTSIK